MQIKPTQRNRPVLVGKTKSGKVLTDEECQNLFRLPTLSFTESEHKTPHWLRTSSNYNELDRYIDTDELLAKESEQLTSAQVEEVDRIKLKTLNEKSALRREIGDLERQANNMEQELIATDDRLKKLILTKQMTSIHKELMKKQENQFFEEMQLDLAVEKQIEEFLGKEKLTVKTVRQFIINVEGMV